MLPVSARHTSASALTALTPILDQTHYLTPLQDHYISSDRLPHLKRAWIENEAQLAPVPRERLDQLVDRLLIHFSASPYSGVAVDYKEALCLYPEDLLCAAYQHIVANHTDSMPPPVSDFIQFIWPELKRRRMIRSGLAFLLQMHVAQDCV